MTSTTYGFNSGNGNGGTEFLSTLPPPRDAVKEWDPTKKFDQQSPSIPQVFRDAMSVREEVFGEQGVPLEAEFDEDDARSFHWVVYASVGTSSSPPLAGVSPAGSPTSRAELERRPSATAQRLPVGTIRLIPPPHRPNQYAMKNKHADADPPESIAKQPREPYIKLGRLAVLSPYRSLGLSKMLINAALEYASKRPENIRPPPSPTTMELANQIGKGLEEAIIWRGLVMVHAQVSVAPLWQKNGFTEELLDENGNVEVGKEDRWVEEGIEHMGMWKRLKLDNGRL